MSKIVDGMIRDLKGLRERFLERIRGADPKRMTLACLPYVLFGYLCDKLARLWRLSDGGSVFERLAAVMNRMDRLFANPFPSFHPRDFLAGVCCAVILRIAVFYKGKNAKKYRRGEEYGSARWGNVKDIQPFVDPVFENNIILTATEWLTMSSRPPNPKFARNKNILVIGGSGSGKTRFFVIVNIMQMHSSFVVTDPKGTI